MFENPRRGRQARNFTTNVPKILDLKSSSEQIFSRKLSLAEENSVLSVYCHVLSSLVTLTNLMQKIELVACFLFLSGDLFIFASHIK